MLYTSNPKLKAPSAIPAPAAILDHLLTVDANCFASIVVPEYILPIPLIAFSEPPVTFFKFPVVSTACLTFEKFDASFNFVDALAKFLTNVIVPSSAIYCTTPPADLYTVYAFIVL